MYRVNSIKENQPVLQGVQWPPLPGFESLEPGFSEYMSLDRDRQRRYWEAQRGKNDYEERLNRFLSIVSTYLFSYCDSPLYLQTDDDFEIALQCAKINLEREVTDTWLPIGGIRKLDDQQQTADYLDELVGSNAGVNHPLFDYLESTASLDALHVFLRNEVCRNEVVDDEVAMMSVGIQGAMKAAVCSNLWDEVGHGTLKQYHTYWLRELVDALSDWEGLIEYRKSEKPWFTAITTNVFNILLSRPGLKFRRYGWFLLNEGWVEPHFNKILKGMTRVGLNAEGVQRYFSAHVSIDPRHTQELIESFRHQKPKMTSEQANEVVRGAHMSLSASLKQFDLMLNYIKAITDGKVKCVSLVA